MIRLFHVSDVHFGAEDPAALSWFAATVAAEQPDAIVMTGDLTMRARSAEFTEAAAWLEALNRPMTVEVGNHDLPYFNILRRVFRPYRRYGKVERMLERPLEIEGLAIVPLRTTARFQLRWNWSKGRVGRRQLAKTLAAIAALPPGGLVIVACHHPLIDADTQSTARTANGSDALAALAKAGVAAVLSGHVHDPFDLARMVGGHAIRLIGAGTLSERTRASRPSFNDIRITDGAIDVVARLMPE